MTFLRLRYDGEYAAPHTPDQVSPNCSRSQLTQNIFYEHTHFSMEILFARFAGFATGMLDFSTNFEETNAARSQKHLSVARHRLLQCQKRL